MKHPHDEHEEDERELHPIDGFFKDLWTVAPKPPTWVIKDLLPVGLSFLAGPPKDAQKSTFTMAISALVAGWKSKVLPDYLSVVENGGPVMILSAEATAEELIHTVKHEMLIQGVANESILVSDNPWLFRLDDENGLEQLMFWLKQRDPRLVIIDPLRDFHQLEEKDSGGMNRLLRPIRQWAVEHDSAVLIVHHTRKLGGEDAGKNYEASDMRGTGAIFGIADGLIMITPKGGGNLLVKTTYKRAQGWERTIRLAAYQFKGQGAVEPLNDMDKMVLSALRLGAPTLDAIVDVVHASKRTVQEAMEKLERVKLVKKNGRSWVAIKQAKPAKPKAEAK